jgi:hypothetical protein
VTCFCSWRGRELSFTLASRSFDTVVVARVSQSSVLSVNGCVWVYARDRSAWKYSASESATEGDNYVMRFLHAIYSLQNCMGMQSAGMCSEWCHESGSVWFEIHVTSLCGRGEGGIRRRGLPGWAPVVTSSRSNVELWRMGSTNKQAWGSLSRYQVGFSLAGQGGIRTTPPPYT